MGTKPSIQSLLKPSTRLADGSPPSRPHSRLRLKSWGGTRVGRCPTQCPSQSQPINKDTEALLDPSLESQRPLYCMTCTSLAICCIVYGVLSGASYPGLSLYVFGRFQRRWIVLKEMSEYEF